MSSIKDQDQIRKILKGDTAAFRDLMTKYQEFSYVVAFRILKNKEDAEEACQDAFVKVYKQLEKFKMESKFSTWLYTIVYRSALDKRKKMEHESNFIDVEDDNMIVVSDLDDAFELLEKEERKQAVSLAMEELDGEEASLLTFYYMKELSLKEISEIVDLNANHLKIKLHRARKKMATILRKQLLSHEIAAYGRGE